MSLEYDVVVVGSGAGGLTAACRAADLGLSVLVIEKSAWYGGSSAISGGSIWIPCNHHLLAQGQKDSPQAALNYLRACSLSPPVEAMLRTYVDQGPAMLRYVEERTRLRFTALAEYADYHQEHPGAMTGYRTLEPEPFDGCELGTDWATLRPSLPGTRLFGRIAMSAAEAHLVVTRRAGWLRTLGRITTRYATDVKLRVRTSRDRRLTLGAALVGALRCSLRDRDVPLWLNTTMQDLVVTDGRVTGVRATRTDRDVAIVAKRGVILACGGFESNQTMRDRYLPSPTDARWSAAPGTGTGDGIAAGARVGARLGAMGAAWFAPTVEVDSNRPAQGLFIERALPGCIIVNGLGRRFVNEAAPYNQLVLTMYENHRTTGQAIPAWMIFDADYRRNYPCGPLLPGVVAPDWALPARIRRRFHRSESLTSLARLIDVPPDELRATTDRFNTFARTGVDEDFARGGNAFDVYYGDSRVVPNPCLGPIKRPPFYAVQIQAGDIGTCGGLRTDATGHVLSESGPIPGLYATGNTTVSMTSGGYPGAGGTLGPAMVFGFVAARTIAGARG